MFCKKVLVLHPNDEQKVMKLQEDVLAAFRKWQCERGITNGTKVFKHFPLWCALGDVDSGGDLQSGLEQNKKIANNVSSIKLFSPKISSEKKLVWENEVSDKCKERPYVFLPVEIAFENGKIIESRLVVSVFSDSFTNAQAVELPGFCFEPKIFRIGDATFDGNQYYITDAVWRKLLK